MATKEERNMGIDMQQAFSVLPNQILLDKRLALESKILWVYIQGKPKDWDFSAYRIASQLDISEKTVRKYLAELEKYGYLVRNRKCTGRVEYYLFCPPIEPSGNIYLEATEPSGKIVRRENSPAVKFTAISNKEELVIKSISNNSNSSELQGQQWSQLIDGFSTVNPFYLDVYKNKTERNSLQAIVDSIGFEKTIGLIKNLDDINTRPFYPKSTKPSELKRHLAVISARLREEKNRDSKKSAPVQIINFNKKTDGNN